MDPSTTQSTTQGLLDRVGSGLRSLLGGLEADQVAGFVWAVLILVVGLLVAQLSRRTALRLSARKMSAQHSMLFGRGIFYGVLTLAVFQALRQAGVDIGVLLGAAGILTVALGFAAQTSASNLISGLFLMGERPFVLGDTIQVAQTVGEVVAVDLLSVKLRTFDNLLVRIPNESLLRSDITNLTRHPIRRLDVPLGVAYDEDPERVRKVLERIADDNELCLDEPKPLFFFLGFGDSSIQLRFSVWSATTHFFDFRTRFLGEIKKAFDAEEIEFPFPQRTLTFGQSLAVETRRQTSEPDANRRSTSETAQ